MKTKLLVFLSIFTLLFAFAACSSTSDSPKSDAPPKEHYKGRMKPIDELVPAERIVILQNVFNPNAREGFYTRETRPAVVEIEYNGGKANAYPISPVIELLHKGCKGTVAVYKTDGGKAEFSANDFRGMYVILERPDVPPVFYNPATKSTASGFAYAVTAEGEVIYSVLGGSYHNVNELLARVGWKTDVTYRFVAADKFHLPVAPDAAATGELRGGLSGVVNGSFPDMSLAHGKINDVLYIEPAVE